MTPSRPPCLAAAAHRNGGWCDDWFPRSAVAANLRATARPKRPVAPTSTTSTSRTADGCADSAIHRPPVLGSGDFLASDRRQTGLRWGLRKGGAPCSISYGRLWSPRAYHFFILPRPQTDTRPSVVSGGSGIACIINFPVFFRPFFSLLAFLSVGQKAWIGNLLLYF